MPQQQHMPTVCTQSDVMNIARASVAMATMECHPQSNHAVDSIHTTSTTNKVESGLIPNKQNEIEQNDDCQFSVQQMHMHLTIA